jgi:hypothetical protein
MFQLELHARHVERQLVANLERRRLERLAQGRNVNNQRGAFRLALGRALVRLGHRVGGERLGSPALTG